MKKLVSCFLVVMLILNMILPVGLFAEEEIQPDIEKNSFSENDSEVGLDLEIKENLSNEDSLEISPLPIPQKQVEVTEVLPLSEAVGDAIDFPDQNLFNALLNNEVDQNGDGVITQEEMKNRTWLDLVNQNITNLEGLDYATELSSLNLYGNGEITNIDPIKGLTNLKTLDLRNTGVSDADRMSFLRLSDQNCSLGFTAFQEIKPTGLSDAYTVSSSDESIVTASIDNSNWWDTKIKLEAKKIGTAQVSIRIGSETKAFTVTVNPPSEGTIQFQDENLYHVLINNGVDTNYDGIITQEEMKIITFLDLQNQQITNLSGLEYATGLTNLNLCNNIELNNVDAIKGLTNLYALILFNTSVSDADKMSFVRLSDQNFTTGMSTYQYIEPQGLSDTFTVGSSDESVVVATIDNTDVQGKIKLDGKKVGTAQVSVGIGTETKEFTVTVDAPPEGTIQFEDPNLFNALINNGVDQNSDGVINQDEMKKQTWLYLGYQNITNLTGLEYATALRELYLYGNTDLTNIEPIKGLTQLEILNLRDTAISDSDKISFVRLSDQNCILGYSNAQVIKPKDLSDTYAVSSSDESIVVASIDHSSWEDKIKLDAKKTGTAKVSLSIGTETKEFTVTVNAPPEGTIQFEDPNLFNALINNGVDQNNDGVINQDEIKEVTYLNLGYYSITSLTGLEYATALRELYLYGNTDLSNIEPIKGLTQLEILELRDTGISDSDRMSFVRVTDQICTAGGSNLQFIKPNGLSDTYTVSSSDESVVAAFIDNSNGWEWKIKLEAKKIGTAQVSVGIGTETKEFTVTVNAPPEGTIQFEDPNLFNALINNGVDQNNDGVINQDEMKEVTYLNLGYYSITSLTGLEYATELDGLYLNGNTDLSNIEPIKGLTQLEILELRDTGISDSDRMSFVRVTDQICTAGGSNLQFIKPNGLSDAYIVSSSDESVVVASIDNSNGWEWKIKLEAKKIGTAQVSIGIGTEKKEFTVTVDAPPEGTIQFEDPNLLNALISHGVDQNSDGVINQEELKIMTYLSLGYQNITSLTGLEYATALRELYLYGNTDLSNIEPIKGLTELEILELRDTGISDSDRMSFVRVTDQICTAGGSNLQFIKPNGLSDAYTVSSSDESVVVASIDNSNGWEWKIKLEAKKIGTAQVSVGIGTETKEFTVTVNAPPEGTIQFEDPNLFNALINNGVDQNSDGVITQEELKIMTYLSLGYQNITNLTGLEYATALSGLYLYGNTELSNIDPIKGLTQLETLNLSDTGVYDSDRMSFVRLSDQNCILGYSNAQVIKPRGISNIYTVSSSDESIVVASIDQSSGEDKIKLDAKKTGTAKVSLSIGTETKEFTVTVKAPPEGTIQFEDNNLFNALINTGVDINNDGAITQEEMKTISWLYLDSQNITNLTGMEYATELSDLYLRNNQNLVNIDPVKGLTQLNRLELSDTGVSDSDRMSFVRLSDQNCTVGFSNVQVIQPRGISDIYTVSSSDESIVEASIDNSLEDSKIRLNAQKLGTAKVSLSIGTETKEFTVTVKAPPEGTIQFEDFNLFSALIGQRVDQNNDGAITQEEMKTISGLSLDSQNITNLTGLEYATELRYLYLGNNQSLVNIDPIKGLTQLDTLNLRDTKVSDSDRISFVRLLDQTSSVGFSTLQFIKPLGLSDSYTVSSSDESIVFASIDNSLWGGNKIKIDPKKTGTARVSVGIGTETKEFTVTVKAPPEGTIQFEDNNLFNALIRDGIDQNSDGAITQEEMKEVTGLDLQYQNITNLTGLEYATELSYLYLGNNQNLVNIDPIKGLTQLYILDLRGTKVSDADRMDFVRISDQTCALGFATYQVIQPRRLSDTYTVSSSDESVVVGTIDNSTGDTRIKMNPKKIGTAQISIGIGTETKEFTVTVKAPPEGAIQFEDFNLCSALINAGVDINNDGAITQEEMKAQTWLYLGYQNITNLTGLEYATALKVIYLYGNGALTNIDPIKGLTQLETLYLWETGVADSDKMSFVRLPDQICAVGYSYFQYVKPNGLSNAFTASSSDESVVKVTIDNSLWQGSKIKIEAKKTGTARVSVLIGTEKKEFTVTVKAPPEGAIQFEDPNLFNALINNGVDTNNDGTISSPELVILEHLNFANCGITSLKGLEGATALKVLSLSNNTELKDIEPIREIAENLTHLYLESTKVSTEDRISLMRIEDISLNEGDRVPWDSKPIGVLETSKIKIIFANPEIAETDGYDYADIYIKGKTLGTTLATVTYEGVTKTFNLTVNQANTGQIIGDVDNNAKVQAFDALMALQIATGKKTGTPAELIAADIGNSGKVEAFDALRILQFATGKITEF